MKENAKQMKSSTHDEASIKKSPQGGCQEIKLYSKEFYFGIKLGFFMTISFYPIFYSIPLILTTSDISNPNEVSLSKMFMFIGTLGNTGLLIANRVYPFLKKRKISFLGGWLILVLSWGFILISYITKVD